MIKKGGYQTGQTYAWYRFMGWGPCGALYMCWGWWSNLLMIIVAVIVGCWLW